MALGVLGVASCGVALLVARRVQFSVVSYSTELFSHSLYLPSLAFGLLVMIAIVAIAGRAAQSTRPGERLMRGAALLWPLLLSAPLALYSLSDEIPPFALSWLVVLGGGWAVFRASNRLPCWQRWRWAHLAAVVSIALLVVLLTLAHTRIQLNFFNHFMLGHADFGHFTEELKNALAGRGLRCDSFENTRLGWHFVPLLYLLVPGYAIWPSPVYLMACSALFVHLVAFPAYYLAHRLSGSVAVGWFWALAWLLLPSQSRLVYSNTYGFQWIYFAMPLLGIMIAAGVTGRWRTCLVMVVVILLCKETAAVATFGWGLYVMLFTPRRRTGLMILLVSAAYFILCTKILIPHFAAVDHYQRLDLFGQLGATIGGLLLSPFRDPGMFFGRLFRPQVLYFLVMLLVPLGFLPLRGWRIATAALPTLLPLLLLENEDWLSIKFWHQCTVLPILFFAGLASMHTVDLSGRAAAGISTWLAGQKRPSKAAMNRSVALAALVCAALGHYFYGYSPISKAYEPYAAAAFLHQPDPRLETVSRLRESIPLGKTILATERLAAHFTDYRRLYTGGRMRPADFVMIDQSDTWDTSGLPRKVSQFASDSDYRLYGSFGSIVVFQRNPEAPPVGQD